MAYVVGIMMHTCALYVPISDYSSYICFNSVCNVEFDEVLAQVNHKQSVEQAM